MPLWRYLWASPATIVGLLLGIVAWLTGGSIVLRDGVVEVHGGYIRQLLRGSLLFPGCGAMTVGHVIIARDRECLERSRSHELVHVGQFERWGPFFIPAYWAVSLWLRCRGYDPYLDHPFEPPPGEI